MNIIAITALLIGLTLRLWFKLFCFIFTTNTVLLFFKGLTTMLWPLAYLIFFDKYVAIDLSRDEVSYKFGVVLGVLIVYFSFLILIVYMTVPSIR